MASDVQTQRVVLTAEVDKLKQRERLDTMQKQRDEVQLVHNLQGRKANFRSKQFPEVDSIEIYMSSTGNDTTQLLCVDIQHTARNCRNTLNILQLEPWCKGACAVQACGGAL